MTMPTSGHDAMQSLQLLFGSLSKLPAPDKVFAELQRLNNNMERLQPDLHKLATSLDGFNANDLRTLGLQLQTMEVSKVLLVLNETNANINKLYNRLWGKS